MPNSNNKFYEKISCRKCQTKTWHKILNKVEERDGNDEIGIWFIKTSFTLQCLGCDSICLLVSDICSEDIDPNTGNPETELTIYPNPIKTRSQIDGYYWCPVKVRDAYSESIEAFNNNKLPLLTAIGIRMTVEAICIEQKITGSLKQKIEDMVKKSIVTPEESKLLHLIRDYGNFSAHEIQRHNQHKLSLCLDIVEGILKTLWVFPGEAQSIEVSDLYNNK